MDAFESAEGVHSGGMDAGVGSSDSGGKGKQKGARRASPGQPKLTLASLAAQLTPLLNLAPMLESRLRNLEQRQNTPAPPP